MRLQNDQIDPAVREILARLTASGHEAYIVGGAVRDLLLSIRPKDYDIATSARPEEVKRLFGRRAHIIGRRFRLVHVYAGGHVFEVCTFRREPTIEERSTRTTDDGVMIWSDNEFGSHEQDAVRRDFTANAIYYDSMGDGRIVDPLGGVGDIEAGTVRMIGDPLLRLAEDPVRLLRAVKLVAQYDLRLEPALDAAVRELASRIALSSKARCFEEVLKILAKSFTFSTLSVCHDYGLLPHFWPGVAECWNSADGGLLRSLLKLRDVRMAAGVYAKSKTLGLVLAAFPGVWRDLRREYPHGESFFWGYGEGLGNACRDAFRRVYEPYAVPRFLQARARDVLLMLPRFVVDSPDWSLTRHPQYKYGREIVSMLAEVQEWPAEIIERWPDAPGDDGRGRRQRPGASASYPVNRPQGPASARDNERQNT